MHSPLSDIFPQVPASLYGTSQLRCRTPTDLALDVGLGLLDGALTQLTGVSTAPLPDIIATNGTRIQALNSSSALELGGDASAPGTRTDVPLASLARSSFLPRV